jgi:hypothetical protein
MKRAEIREVLSAYCSVLTELQEDGLVASDFDFEELVDKTMVEVDHKKFN